MRGQQASPILAILVACQGTPEGIGHGTSTGASVTAMVAARELAVGVPITEDDLYAKLFPDTYLPGGTYSDPASVVGLLPRFRILPHEPLRVDAMAQADAPSVPSDRIPMGMRVVSVPTRGASPVVGHAVDVWWSPTQRPCIFMPAIAVHGVGPDAAELLVPPEGVHRLAVAARDPSFRLTVRDASDDRIDPAALCTR